MNALCLHSNLDFVRAECFSLFSAAVVEYQGVGNLQGSLSVTVLDHEKSTLKGLASICKDPFATPECDGGHTMG